MFELKLLEIINKLSFVFSFLSYFFYYRFTSIKYTIIYIVTVTMIALGVYLKEKKRFYAFAVFLIIPVLNLFLQDLFLILFIYSSVIVYLYIDKGINYINFSFSTFKLKNIVYAIIVLFSLITKTSYMISKVSVLFMIIFFISSIALFRSLKYLRNYTNIKEIRKQNLKYSIGIILISLLLSVKKFWKMVILGIKAAYLFVLNIIFNCLAFLLKPLGNLIENLINFLKNLISQRQNQLKIQSNSELYDSEKYTPLVNEQLSIVLKIILKWLLIIFLIFLTIYIIKKLSKRYQNKVVIKQGYIEEKEFIFTKNNKKTKKRRFFKPKNKKDLIRYYYSKFLSKCKKRKIFINKYNTTLEINLLAKEKFNILQLEKIREIYIKTRYGNIDPNEIELEKFKESYKKLE